MSYQSSSRQFLWQTAFAIITGILIGIALLAVVQKRPAQATPKGAMMPPRPQGAGNAFGLQILPTLNERMNVLVMGVDSNGLKSERFTGCRSDTMILVSLDPVEHTVGMISIPRDSRVKIAGNHGTDKINSAHAFGGPELAVQTVSENFMVPVNHYVVVDTQGLKQLCELLGPIEVLVEKEMHYHDWAAHLHVDLKPGLQTLNPSQVEQYVRFRHDARGDIGRIERQQWFFRQAANKLKDPQFLLRLPELVKIAHDYIHTDLTIEDMARIATFAKDLKPDKVVTATLPGEASTISGGSYWLPDETASKAVFNRVLGLASSTGEFVQDETTAAPADPSLEPVSEVSMTAKPVTIAIKYPKGCAEGADQLEKRLNDLGYRVRYKWLTPAVDCQHEHIIQMSVRADESETASLRQAIGEIETWPTVLALESKPCADFTIVLSPNSGFAKISNNVAPTSRRVLPN